MSATNSPYTAYHYLLAELAERRRSVKKFLRDTMTDVQSE